MRAFIFHIVAQIIETKLIVGCVCDVAFIRGAAFMFLNVGHNNACGEAKEAVYPAHPFCVAAGQIVVHGHDMDALALNGVQVAGQCFGQGLTFPRAHFGNLAAMQNNTANHLHVKMPHAHNAL